MRLRDVYRRWRVRNTNRGLAAWARLAHARFDCPRWIDRPPGKRVLVLSPHPDDDAIGAGGTLVKHARAGCVLTALVLTGGGVAASVDVRREEQRAAAEFLGIERVIFWDEPDGGLAPHPENASRLRIVLEDIQPDLVYLPSFLDTHPDHRTITALLARALEGTALSFTVAIYETTTPVIPNVLVNVSAEMATKVQAVEAHQSQLVSVDYVALVRGLGRWRSGTRSREVRYAEAFYVDDARAYVEMWRQVKG